jgi:glycogen synthase
MRFALVSREVFPFGGGGLGAYVSATAQTLSQIGDVTILTQDCYEKPYRRLEAAKSELLPSPDVRFEFIREPRRDDCGSYFHHLHLWSARAYEKLTEVYADRAPDLIEFPDYLAEGAVTIQARRTFAPALQNSIVCLRLYTSSEMTSVLNGQLRRDVSNSIGFDLERYALHHADRIIWPGGDILDAYRRFYGGRVAPGLRVPHPVLPTPDPDGGMPSIDGPLRLLYVGRLERRKGVQNLVRALTSIQGPTWEATLVGGDTETAPLGTSMRAQLELMVGEDSRLKLLDNLTRLETVALMREHHVVVVPSLWECWPNVALEAFSQNRPVLATPVGGLVSLVEHGRSGWLARDTTAGRLGEAIEHLLDNKAEVEASIRTNAPREQFETITSREAVRDAYAALATTSQRRRGSVRRPTTPLVSVIVPYYRLDAHVEDTLRSIFDQTYPRLEVIVVNDGSFRREDWILGELSTRFPITVLTQQNSGLGSARNFGIASSRGRYVFPLDADNMAKPTFVERCIEVLENDLEIAYVTSWSRYVDEEGRPLDDPRGGWQPIGNELAALSEFNTAGDAAAVLRRRLFDLGFAYSVDATSYEDWLLYRELAAAGFHGHAIPERLLLYRVRPESMIRTIAELHHARLFEEMEAHLVEGEMQWTS